MLKILSFNAALQDINIFGKSFYRPVDFIESRLKRLPPALVKQNADFIFLQEVFSQGFQKLIYNALVKQYPYIVGMCKNKYGLRVGNELLTLSRYPIQSNSLIRFKHASREELLFTSKGFYHSSVIHPNLGEIQLINFHTTAGGKEHHPEHPAMEFIRQRQIEQILDYIKGNTPVILVGDLNAGPQTSRRNYQQVLDAGFIDICDNPHDSLLSWDPENPLVKNGLENHLPAQRIDHIFMSEDLHRIHSGIRSNLVLNDSFISGPDFSYPLSDHYGIQAELD